MKKILVLGSVLLAALVVSSCNKAEVYEASSQDNAIVFDNYIGRAAQSKAAVVDATSLQTSGFGVFAYLHSGTPNYDAANFMNNEKVSGASWTYTNTKYWPKDESNLIDFLAYGPYGSSNIALEADGGSVLTFTVNSEVADQTDLVVAVPQKNQTKTIVTTAPKTGTVDFQFKHMLSRIAFYAKKADNYNNAKIKINSVSLAGEFASTGTVNMSVDAPAISAATTEAITYTITDGTNYNAGEDLTTTSTMLNSADDYLMVIPNATAADYILTVNYTVTYGDGNTVTNVIPMDVTNQTFQAGKAYKFNISVALDAIEFNVTSVDGWGDETGINVDIQG